MNGTLYGVSVGPGDPELMTLKAVRIIQQCNIIAAPRASEAGAQVALGIARQAVPSLAEKEILELYLPMTRDKETLQQTQQRAADQLVAHLCKGEDIAFLTLGDLSIYSTYCYLHNIVKQMGFSAKMIAGVPSFCAAAARLGEGLTEAAKPLHIIPASYQGVEEALDWPGTKVLMKTGRSFDQIKELLRARGLLDAAQLVQRCGLPGERVFRRLEDADEPAGYLSIILVKEEIR